MNNLIPILIISLVILSLCYIFFYKKNLEYFNSINISKDLKESKTIEKKLELFEKKLDEKKLDFTIAQKQSTLPVRIDKQLKFLYYVYNIIKNPDNTYKTEIFEKLKKKITFKIEFLDDDIYQLTQNIKNLILVGQILRFPRTNPNSDTSISQEEVNDFNDLIKEVVENNYTCFHRNDNNEINSNLSYDDAHDKVLAIAMFFHPDFNSHLNIYNQCKLPVQKQLDIKDFKKKMEEISLISKEQEKEIESILKIIKKM